jgi:hypothetical protein
MLLNKHFQSEFNNPMWLHIFFPKTQLWILSTFASKDSPSFSLRQCVEKSIELSLSSEELLGADDSLCCSLWPMLLRKNKAPAVLLELAYYESLLCFLRTNLQGDLQRNLQTNSFSKFNCKLVPIILRGENKIYLNPSLQFCSLIQCAEFLGKKAGVYVLYQTLDGLLKEQQLSREQAALIELATELVGDGAQISWDQLSAEQKTGIEDLLVMQIMSISSGS